MFLRFSRRIKNGKAHRYWSIVENKRCAGGRVVRAVQRSLHELDRLQCSDAANSEAISGVGDILGTIEAQNVGRE